MTSLRNFTGTATLAVLTVLAGMGAAYAYCPPPATLDKSSNQCVCPPGSVFDAKSFKCVASSDGTNR
ncbi:MAG: hypothetical protein GC150_03635 [Rhizobiales bacterium]|nr:hypothetical protein [Hyphomicrobiales bacterium]